tara:strand:- start:25 stop:981 length:957 start_codon:yes stop_codon:yes gene_type:complete
MNELLSIVIPSYDRLSSLSSNLFGILEELKEYSIPVYISDDSPHSEIHNFVSEYAKSHKYIYYYKNEPRLGHDKNFVKALKRSKAAYTWIIGDRVRLKENAIKTVIDLISIKQIDIISVNKSDRNIDIPSRYFSEPINIFDMLGWHLTYTGATIYSKQAIKTLDLINIDQYRNFPHIGLIFNHLLRNCSFFWINDYLIFALPEKESYWIDNAFSVFIDDWENAVQNLPDIYHKELKSSTILKHSLYSNLFSTKFFLKMRMNDNYNTKIFKKYKNQILKHSNKSLLLLCIISVIPKWILKIGYYISILLVTKKSLNDIT